MKIPNKLKIGALWYEVKEVSPFEIDCDGASGDASTHRQDIRISNSLKTQEMKEVTLFHEILHCINIQIEHESVEYIAQAMYQVLRENDLLK